MLFRYQIFALQHLICDVIGKGLIITTVVKLLRNKDESC